jgi:hypothetical protein
MLIGSGFKGFLFFPTYVGKQGIFRKKFLPPVLLDRKRAVSLKKSMCPRAQVKMDLYSRTEIRNMSMQI